MESSEFDTSLVNRQSGPEARILVCVKRSGVFLRSTKRRNTRLGLCSQGHSFVSLRITKVCFTAPNWLKVQEKACALAYRITRSIVVETFRFTYVHTHFLLFRIRLPSFPSLYQIPNPGPYVPLLFIGQIHYYCFHPTVNPIQQSQLPWRLAMEEGHVGWLVLQALGLHVAVQHVAEDQGSDHRGPKQGPNYDGEHLFILSGSNAFLIPFGGNKLGHKKYRRLSGT